MTGMSPETNSDRRLFVQLVIVVALGVALGRLVSAERLYEPSVYTKRSEASAPPSRWPATPPKPMPTFGSNDRSRWATVVSLVERGTYVIGKRDKVLVERNAVGLFAPAGPLQAATLYAVGFSERVGSDSGIIFEDGWQSVDKVLNPETLEYYSSKPPLLATLMAGAYWPIYHGLGYSLQQEPFLVVRFLLGLLNLLPLPIYLWLIYLIGVRYATQTWTPFFLLMAAAFGTLLNPFVITFSNHVPAVYGALFLLALLLKIDQLGSSASVGWFLLAGLIGGFNVTNELPSLAFTALALLLLARISWQKALFAYLPMTLVSIGALFALNYIAIGQFAPAYSTTDSIWYQYEGSHWLRIADAPRRGIDFASNVEGKGEYAFHLLLGHHGFFSLTPLFLVGLVGLLMGLISRSKTEGQSSEPPELPRWLAPSVLLISVVVIGFYIYRSNNYGGWCNGPRWLLWLVPLWLVGMIPIVDRMATSRWGRGLVLTLLLFSVLSANHFIWSPWRHPWIYNAMDSAGKIPY